MTDLQSQKPLLLIVDDDQFLLSMYALKFTNSGFQVETVNTASSALQKLRDGFSPDMILCDLVMPTVDGFEFIKQFRNEHLSPKSALVVLTNQGQASEIDQAKTLGVDGYIVKASAIPSEVVEEVKVILAKKK